MRWRLLSRATKQTFKIPNKFLLSLVLVSGMLSTALLFSPAHASADAPPTIVKPSAMNGWYFWNDKNDTFTGSPGELDSGPAFPPLGVGSVRLGPLTDNGATAAGYSVIATDAYSNTPLANITALSYSTFQPGPTLAIALQFDVKYRTTDTLYGGRLVFEPYQNGAVSVGSGWQPWSPLAGKWWASHTNASGTGGTQVVDLPAGNCGQATPCTWAKINAAFPNAVIGGRFLLKAGSNWSGFDGNADGLTVGVSGINTTFDFEPETACTTICYVNAATGNDAFGGDTPASAKKTIGAAVNQISIGGTVNVGAGTYTEQVVIDKNLTLTGSGAASTIIQAPSELTNDPDGAKDIVLFTGAITAEISGFTIQGPVNGLNFGIYVRDGATANIHDNAIKDVRDTPLSDAQTGIAIEVGKYNDTAPYVMQTGTATIANNTISGYQKMGIAVENTGSSATITGNTVTGAGPITTTAQNGIYIRRGATGTVKNNTVTGNAYDGPSWSAIGIGALHAGAGVVIQGNTTNHNSANIYVWKPGDGIQIKDNQVADSSSVDQNAVAGITVQSDGSPSCCGGSTGNYLTGVVISGNTVQNNLSGGTSNGDGIDLYAVDGATVSNNTITGASHDGILVGGSKNSTFTNNTLTNNGLVFADTNAAGIDFGGQASGNGGLNPVGGFTVHSNTFSGNKNAIWNYDSTSVDAMNNYWGSANPTFASIIGGTASHTPWYTDNSLATLSTAADLTSLALSSGTLSPTFSSGTTSYTTTVANSVSSVTVTDTASTGANATVSGGSNLAVGANTVTVTVTSADGTASKTYTITVNRSAATQTLPDSSGNATVSNSTPQVVVTSSSQPLTITVNNDTNNATIDYSSLQTSPTTAVIPQTTINTQNANVQIQGGTTVTASGAWDGILNLPTIQSNSSVSIPTSSGTTTTVATVIDVGSDTVHLTFDKAVRLVIPGQAGKLVGFVRNGVFTQITDVCSADSQAAGDSLAASGNCYINASNGTDMVVWTKHFTKFVTYTQAVNPPTPVTTITTTSSTPSASNTYVVQSGDTLSAIAQKFGIMLSRLENLNPQAGHPAGNFDLILPGDVLNVGGAVSTASVVSASPATGTSSSTSAATSTTTPQPAELGTSTQPPQVSAPGVSSVVASTSTTHKNKTWLWIVAAAAIITVAGVAYYAYNKMRSIQKRK